ncbi:MAG: clostripain-related cysteine peptidase [Cyanobacteriota bacterium]
MNKSTWLKRAVSLTLTSALTLALASCQSENVNTEPNLNNDEISALSRKKDGQKKWTFMVHLAADNNLYPFGLEDINEMEAGLKNLRGNDVNVVVLFDGTQKGDSAVYEIKADPAGMNKEIISPKVDNPVAAAGSEIDSGNKELAGKFLDWATTTYPADHYAYVVWNHGAGWQREGKGKNGQILKPIKNATSYSSAGELITKEFAWDDNGGHMSTVDLNGILDPVAKKIGRKLDVLDFDACLMAHVEVAYQMRNSVDYLVASEKTEPGAGNPYGDIFSSLGKNPSMSGKEFASAIVKDYGKSYTNGSQGTSSVTLSATSTEKLVSDLVPAINSFAGSMTSSLDKDKVALMENRNKTTNYENGDCKDLGHFAKLVSADARVSADVKDKANGVLTALKSAVVEEFHSGKTSKAVADSTGLVMYMPGKGQAVNSRYAKLDFASEKWDEFLQAFVK